MTEQEGAYAETVAESQRPENNSANQENVNWQAARETMAQQKQRLEQLEQQNALLQRWAEQQSQQQQQVAQPANPFEGLSRDDVMTVGEFQGVLNSTMSQKEEQFNRRVADLEKQQKLMSYRSKYQDYDNVVQDTLKKAETNPALAQAIMSSSDPHLLAYELGRSGYAEQRKAQANAARILENSNKPGSIANASTGGSALSSVDHIMNMSDADFEARIAAVKRGG